MLKLSKDSQKTIEFQMYNKARDIDVAVYNCMVKEDFPRMLYTTALSGYQNKDGGFAHALEIDNYNKESNIPQVVEAFRLSRLAGLKNISDDSIFEATIKKAFNWLYNRLTNWCAVIPSNNDAICASWYKYSDVNINRFGEAPMPEILGYTLFFTNENNPYYKKANIKSLDMIKKFLDKKDLNIEEIKSYAVFLSLIEEKGLYTDLIDNFKNHLYEIALAYIEKDKSKYNTPVLRPLDVFNGYTECEEINKLIDMDLDYIIESIKPHGLWDAPFDWSGEIGEGSTAQIKWIGAISCKYYGLLKKFNRIEE